MPNSARMFMRNIRQRFIATFKNDSVFSAHAVFKCKETNGMCVQRSSRRGLKVVFLSWWVICRCISQSVSQSVSPDERQGRKE